MDSRLLISPPAGVRAGKLMLSEMNRCETAGESFAFETTLSGRSFARRIPEWQAIGYRVSLIFLSLRSARLAIARVKARVAQGGHHVPAKIVRHRFRNGLQNFELIYRPLVDDWELYDNSGNRPVLLTKGERQ
jgi:predicted ABC-type ATPase